MIHSVALATVLVTAVVSALPTLATSPAPSTPLSSRAAPGLAPGDLWNGYDATLRDLEARPGALIDGYDDGAVLVQARPRILTYAEQARQYGVAKLDGATGTPRSEFGHDGFASFAAPTGKIIDIAARPTGGALALLDHADPERVVTGAPRQLGVAALDDQGRPDRAYPESERYGEVGLALVAPSPGTQLVAPPPNPGYPTKADVVGADDGGAVVAFVQQRTADAVSEVVVHRLRPDGTTDPGFGAGGRALWQPPEFALPDLGYAAVTVHALEKGPSGGLHVLVEVKYSLSTDPFGTHDRLYILNLDALGRLAVGVGERGVIDVPDARPGCTRAGHDVVRPLDVPFDVASDGRLVIASPVPIGGANGRPMCGHLEQAELLVQVFRSDGTPDPAFSGDGKVRHAVRRADAEPYVRASDTPRAVALDTRGRVLVSTRPYDALFDAAVRFEPDGQLDAGFRTDEAYDFPTSSEIVPTASGNYVVANGGEGRLATLVLGAPGVPSLPSGPQPVAEQDQGSRLVGPADRPWRPGDVLTLELGTWMSVPIDHFDVSLLGCEPRARAKRDCREGALDRQRIGPDAEAVDVPLPAAASGQDVQVVVTAVGTDGGRHTMRFRGQVASTSYLTPDEPTPLPPTGGLREFSGVRFVLPDGTDGTITNPGGQYAPYLQISERRPDDVARVVVKSVLPAGHVVGQQVSRDGWFHVVVSAGPDLFVLDRDPTGLWTEPLQLTAAAGGVQGHDINRAGVLVATGSGGRAALVFAEFEPRTTGRTPPVVVRTRDDHGWAAPAYLDNPTESYEPCPVYGCFYEDYDRNGLANGLRVAINDAGGVRVLFTRQVDSNGDAEFERILTSADRTPDGQWSQRDIAVSDADVSTTALGMVALGDGSTLLTLQERHLLSRAAVEGGPDLFETRVLSQVAEEGRQFVSDGSTVAGHEVLRTTDDRVTKYSTVTTNTVADGTQHWRTAVVQKTNLEAAGATISRTFAVEGSGGQVPTVQQVESRRLNPLESGAVQSFVAGPAGRALLVTYGPSGSSRYSVAEGPGSFSAPQALVVGDSSAAVRHPDADHDTPDHLEPRPVAQYRNGAWWVSFNDSYREWPTPHRLTRGLGAPSVALVPSSDVRAGNDVAVRVDLGRTADPDAGPLAFAWDLDHDGAFDDATGSSVVVRTGETGVQQEVAVRATATDGDRAVATQVLIEGDNARPRIHSLGGPFSDFRKYYGAAVFEAVVDDDEDSTRDLQFRWAVDGVIVDQQVSNVLALNLGPGATEIEVTVTDSQGASSRLSRTVGERAPQPPADQPPTLSMTGPARTADGDRSTFRATARDPERRPMTYTWWVDRRPVVGQRGAAAQLVLRSGLHTVTVGVLDKAGHLVLRSRTVRVVHGTRLPDEPLDPVRLSGRNVLRATVSVPRAGLVRVALVAPRRPLTSWGTATVRATRRGATPVVVRLTPAGVRALRAVGTHRAIATVSFKSDRRRRAIRTQSVSIHR